MRTAFIRMEYPDERPRQASDHRVQAEKTLIFEGSIWELGSESGIVKDII